MTMLTDTFRPPPDANGKPFPIPAALVAAFLLQTAGALFWAGSAAERISVLERDNVQDRDAIAKVAVLEEETAQMKDSLGRIEAKLDRLQSKTQP